MNDEIQPLLFSRYQAARRLGVSVPTIIQLEKEGRLTPIKLRGPMGNTHYRVEQVDGLANGGSRPRYVPKRG